MSVPRRVVVTGMGTVSAAGLGGRDMVRALHARRDSALRTVRGFDTSALPCHLAGEVDDEALDALFDRDAARRLSRICRLTVAACRLAVEDAGVDAGPSLGLVVGTEYGDFRSSGEFATGFLKRGPSGLSPMLFPGTVMNAMGAAASIAIGVKGPTVTVNQVTVSSEIALARGAALIVHGRAEAVLAGGVDELCGPVYQRLAHELGVLSPMRRPDGQREGVEGCRPYAPDHNGPALGEGATFLVLEDHELARARGATILAELRAARWGNIPVAPYAAPVARRDPRSVLRASLAEARVPGTALGSCWGSGTGDPALDDWELALLDADLGERPDLFPPRSAVALVGQHGGIGALRAAAATLYLAAGPALVHGLARGGCRAALVLASPAGR
jgi:3-oxoacyl-[acyl-carrier-protein] synthase II